MRDGTAQRTHAYGLLLLLIFTSICFQLAAPSEGWTRMVTATLSIGSLILAFRVSGIGRLGSRGTAITVAGLAAAVIVILILADPEAAAPAHALSAAVIFMAIGAIAFGVFRQARSSGAIDVRTVSGVLCIYLLVGLFFSSLFQLIGAVESVEFFRNVSDATPNEFLYFSYVTMTTTGYGDFTAATDLGRSAAIAEALIGQIYLVTVVALIVTRAGRRPRPDTQREG